MIILLSLILVSLIAASVGSDPRIRAVSVFRNDEVDFHKYSAILAASEPFRLQMEKDFFRSMNPLSYLLHQTRGTLSPSNNALREKNRAVDSACKRYENKVSEIVRSYGLSPDNFNSLSRKLIQEPFLKQRVLLQSYYYKIAADLEANIKATLPVLPNVNAHHSLSMSLPIFKRHSENENHHFTGDDGVQLPLISRFSKCLKEVENLRIHHRRKLQGMIGVDRLPSNMCDPAYLPAMSDEIKEAQRSFQSKSADIIHKYEFEMEDFDALREKMNSNIFFRFNVKKELKKLKGFDDFTI